jgi:hypothetical protein
MELKLVARGQADQFWAGTTITSNQDRLEAIETDHLRLSLTYPDVRDAICRTGNSDNVVFAKGLNVFGDGDANGPSARRSRRRDGGDRRGQDELAAGEGAMSVSAFLCAYMRER